jgi:hypothetical protein
MGEIVAGFGVPHSPHVPEQVRQTGPSHPVLPLYAQVAAALDAAQADALVIFDCDHFSTFFLDNWPTFAIGVGEKTAGPNDRTVMPRYAVPLHAQLSAHIHRHGVGAGFDLTLLQDFEIDHSVLVPLHFLTPRMQIPIVPVYVNGFVPPLPSGARCHALGRAIRGAVESFGPLRVAALASGQFSLEIGGPKVTPGKRQGVPDPDWTVHVARRLRAGETAALIEEATFERLQRAGNIGGELLTWIAMLGVIGDRKPTWFHVQPSEGDAYAVWQWG